jgi:hypothetical protein
MELPVTPCGLAQKGSSGDSNDLFPLEPKEAETQACRARIG